jgi:hypothetical protein
MTLNLYYCRAEGQSGRAFDQHLFVRAHSYAEALDAWCAYYDPPNEFTHEMGIGIVPDGATSGTIHWTFIRATEQNFRFRMTGTDADGIKVGVWEPAQ